MHSLSFLRSALVTLTLPLASSLASAETWTYRVSCRFPPKGGIDVQKQAKALASMTRGSLTTKKIDAARVAVQSMKEGFEATGNVTVFLDGDRSIVRDISPNYTSRVMGRVDQVYDGQNTYTLRGNFLDVQPGEMRDNMWTMDYLVGVLGIVPKGAIADPVVVGGTERVLRWTPVGKTMQQIFKYQQDADGKVRNGRLFVVAGGAERLLAEVARGDKQTQTVTVKRYNVTGPLLRTETWVPAKAQPVPGFSEIIPLDVIALDQRLGPNAAVQYHWTGSPPTHEKLLQLYQARVDPMNTKQNVPLLIIVLSTAAVFWGVLPRLKKRRSNNSPI